MTVEMIAEILKKHKKWLDNEKGGERANLRGAGLSYANLRDANLRGADLRDADLRGADLSYANLRDANLRGADLRDADLRGADLRDADLRDANLRGADLRDADVDYSCWPLWCGSLRVHIDERIAKQLLYHLLFNVAYSKHISDETKRTLLTQEIVALANDSHVVSVHNKSEIETYKEEEICQT